VTNTNNNATGNKTAQTTSAYAKITIQQATSAQIPKINVQPQDGVYQYGQTINPLSITAAVDDGGTLSYQWYSATSSEGAGIVIHNAKGTTYQPVLNGIGDYYFYVVVTNTNNDMPDTKTAQITSAYAMISLQGVITQTPHISVQPQGGGYLAGQTIAPLSVTASVTDDGILSYQWYEATSNGVTGTAINNSNTATYQPVLSTVGNYYFYVVITNTNNNATGSKTAQTTSAYAMITIYDSGIANANATITVDTATKYQYIRGYGGMDVAWANYPETSIQDYETMYDPAKLGYNIMRVMIPPNNIDVAISVENLVDTYRPNYYEGVKIVNKYGGYVLASPWSPPKEWKSNNSINGAESIEYNEYNQIIRMDTGWLKYENYQDYANYLKSYAQHMHDNGAPIYVVSIQHEPNYTAPYDGCEWTPQEMRDFFIQVGHFTNGVSGYGGGKSTSNVLIMNGESANNPEINIAVLVDPVSRAAIDLLGRHIYGEQTRTLWRYGTNGLPLPSTTPDNSTIPSILNQPDGTKMEVWMTDHEINSGSPLAYPSDSTWSYIWRFMNDIDLTIRMNNENAFIWWAAKRFFSLIGDGSYGTYDGAILPRGYGLSHYAKYSIDTTRIGFTMTGTTAGGTDIGAINTNNSTVVNSNTFSLDNTTARITAFVSPDGNEISLIMWTPTDTNGQNGIDMGTIEIRMPAGFTIGSASGIRSTNPTGNVTRFHELYAPLIASDRHSAYVTLPPSHIISVKFTRQ